MLIILVVGGGVGAWLGQGWGKKRARRLEESNKGRLSGSPPGGVGLNDTGESWRPTTGNMINVRRVIKRKPKAHLLLVKLVSSNKHSSQETSNI